MDLALKKTLDERIPSLPEAELAPRLADAAAAIQPAADPVVTPEFPGRYVLRGEKGRGGQSIVHVAFDTHVGREVALKELLARGERAASPDARSTAAAQRFLREARITGQLEHPGIVPVYEIGRRADGRYYATQRLVQGRTLEAALAQCTSLAERLALLSHFVALCHALAYAHGRGVIHRDLKPANIMVGSFGETVVLDWGLAREADGAEPGAVPDLPAEAGATLDGTVMGTPPYMSPEQAQGKVHELDARSDVFSLGVILYQLLTGELPFQGKSSTELLYRIVNERPRTVHELCPRAPAELAAIAERALSRDAADRYPDGGALAREVEAYQNGERVGAYDYSSMDLLRRFVGRNRALTAVTAAAAILLVAAGVELARAYEHVRGQLAVTLAEKGAAADAEQNFGKAAAFYAASRVQRDSPAARWGLALAGPRAPQPVLRASDDVPGAMSLSPDGAHIAAATRSEVMVLSASTGAKLWQAHANEGKVYFATFSPDGAMVAATGDDGTIRLFESAQGKELRKIQAGSQPICCLAFTPDGRTLAAATMDRFVRLIDVKTGAQRAARQFPGYMYAVAFSPAGDLLAAAAGDGGIELLSPRGLHQLGRLVGHERDATNVVFSPDGKLLASASFDRTVRLWDVAARRQLARFDALVAVTNPYTVAFSRDGRFVGSPGPDGAALVWDVATHERRLRIDAQRDDLMGLAFGPDLLLTAGSEGVLRGHRYESAIAAQGWASVHEGEARAVSFSADGSILASVGFDRVVRLHDGRTGKVLRETHLAAPALDVAFDPSGSRIAVALESGTVAVLTASDFRELSRVPLPPIGTHVEFFGGTIVAEGLDDKVRALSIADGHELWSSIGARFALAGTTLAIPRRDAVVLVDVRTGLDLRTVEIGARSRCAALSPDGTLLAAATNQSDVVLVDVASGKVRARAPGPSSAQELRFSPDGRLLAAAGGQLMVFNVSDLKPVARRIGVEGYATRALFSPDGAFFASSNLGGVVRLWPVRDALAALPAPGASLSRALSGAQLRLDGVDLADAP